jgi:hypothetical protein
MRTDPQSKGQRLRKQSKQSRADQRVVVCLLWKLHIAYASQPHAAACQSVKALRN